MLTEINVKKDRAIEKESVKMSSGGICLKIGNRGYL
jgi:hypothetical protein